MWIEEGLLVDSRVHCPAVVAVRSLVVVAAIEEHTLGGSLLAVEDDRTVVVAAPYATCFARARLRSHGAL